MDHSCFRFRINSIWCCGQHPTARSSCYTREHMCCLYIVDIYIDAYILSAFVFTWNTLEKSIKISKNISKTETHTCSVKAACAMHVFPKIIWWPSVQNYCFPGDSDVCSLWIPQISQLEWQLLLSTAWVSQGDEEPSLASAISQHPTFQLLPRVQEKGGRHGGLNQLFAILEKEIYFLSAPVWTINQRLNDL